LFKLIHLVLLFSIIGH